MLQYAAINKTTLACLRELSSIKSLNSCVLVGGTALALLYGHRISIDIDLFSYDKLDFDLINSDLLKIPNAKKIMNNDIMQEWNINGVKVYIVQYPYPFIFPVNKEDDIILASDKEISAMKLSAIANRGVKKDFYDIYFLLKKFSLNDILSFFSLKYRSDSLFHIIKSLVYFDDADKSEDPVMIKKVAWDFVKDKIKEEVSNFLC